MRYGFDSHVLDAARRELRRGAERVAVEPQVFDLLLYLIEHRDRVVSRDELLDVIWGGRIVSESAITNAINGARRAIGDSGEDQRLIRTAPRKGFRFVGRITEDVDPAAGAPPAAYPRRRAALAFAAAILLLCIGGVGGHWWLNVRPPTAQVAVPPAGSDLPELPIALLPFDDLSAGATASPLAAGISESLATDLSRNQTLLVKWFGKTPEGHKIRDAREIGRELGVDYIVQGTILRADDRVRVAAQLVDTQTGTYLWATRFDSESRNVLDQEEEVVGRIVNELTRSLTVRRADWSRREPDAATLVWRGHAVMTAALTQDKYSEAVRLYDQGLARLPDSVSAEAGIANALAVRSHYLDRDAAEADMRRATQLIEAALKTAPDDAGAHYVMGQVLRVQGHCDEALDQYQTAIALNRNHANAYAFLAACLLRAGRLDLVTPLAEKAVRLDPTNKGVGWAYLRLGVVALLQSRNDEAIPSLEKARVSFAGNELRHDVSATHSWLAAAYALKGDTGHAAAELAQAEATGPFPRAIAAFCGPGCWCADPTVKGLVNDSYYKGLQLAGWSAR
jgi:DNA-binding winged helix-turn-helix (wHTH) protein/TolB-like protein/Flp pilus assembly protein TadD